MKLPTPGPWHAANGCEVHDKAAQFDASGARIGDTPNMICRVEYPYGCAEGRAATAHAIAAVPALLAALIDIRDSSGYCDAAKARAAMAIEDATYMQEFPYLVTFENGDEYSAAIEVPFGATDAEIREAIDADVTERISSHPEDRETDFGAITGIHWGEPV